jgi:hypothetical protein
VNRHPQPPLEDWERENLTNHFAFIYDLGRKKLAEKAAQEKPDDVRS